MTTYSLGGSFLLDPNVKWAGASAKTGTKFVNTYSLPHDGRRSTDTHIRFDVPVLYFLASPGVEPWWFTYREIDAWSGLEQPWGGHMPGGLRTFPAKDVEFDMENMVKRDVPDWCKNMIKTRLVTPRDGVPYEVVPVKPKVLTSAVVVAGQFNKGKNRDYDTSPGDLIMLSLTKNQFDKILEFVEGKLEIDPSFSLTDYAVSIHQSGGVSTDKPLKISIRLEKDMPSLGELFGDAKPENAQKAVEGWRARAEKHLGQVMREHDPNWIADAEEETEMEVAEQFVTTVSDDGSVDWETVGTKDIKQALKAAGVIVPAGATRPDMVAMARKHLDATPF